VFQLFHPPISSTSRHYLLTSLNDIKIIKTPVSISLHKIVNHSLVLLLLPNKWNTMKILTS
jgi:hypothetical protein